jgi:hypothetical protein
VTASELERLRRQLDAAREEFDAAERIVALLEVDEPDVSWLGAGPVAVARDVIERDLARRRVEAWASVLDRLRTEGRRVGLTA